MEGQKNGQMNEIKKQGKAKRRNGNEINERNNRKEEENMKKKKKKRKKITTQPAHPKRSKTGEVNNRRMGNGGNRKNEIFHSKPSSFRKNTHY